MSETSKPTLPLHRLTRENEAFRKLRWTGERTRPVLMAVSEGGEAHEGHHRLACFVAGAGEAGIGKATDPVGEGVMAIVPSGAWHNLRDTGAGMLRLQTTCNPPEHDPRAAHGTRAEADG